MSATIAHTDASCVSRITEYLHGDDAPRWALWITSPRCEVAYKVFHLGLAIEKLAGKIHVDLAGDRDEDFNLGYRLGYRKGHREGAEGTLNLMLKPTTDESPSS